MRRLPIPLLVLLLTSLSILALPSFAHASIPYWGPIIPAGVSVVGNSQTCPLGWAGLILTINNIISLGITIAIAFVAPLSFAYAGFLYAVNPVNPSGRSQAKSVMLNTVIGIVIALAGYLIVDSLLGVLYNANATGLGGTPWYSIITSGGQDPCIKIAASLSQSAGATGSGVNNDINDCPGNLICGAGGGCAIDPELDNGDGTAGAACQPANPNCVSPLVCDNTDTCNTTAVNPAPIPSSCTSGLAVSTAAGPIPAQICSAASAYRGSSTAAGPGGGTVACAWAVNNVLTNAGVANLDSTSVASLESALTSGRGTLVGTSSAVCGDIAVQAQDGHVGICMNNGCTSVLSNSSSKASFSWVSDITFAPTYSGGPGRIYQVNN